MNKVILIGNLTKDPELRTTPSGKQVCKCSIATNESYKDQSGQWKQIADYHNLVIWGNRAGAFAQYNRKGSKVSIEGKVKTRSYQDNQGVTKYITEIVVDNFEFLTPKNQQGNGNYQNQDNYQQPQNKPEPQGQYQDDDIQIEDIPF